VNPGLVSLGALAMLALGGALVANLVWLPLWLRATETKPATLVAGSKERSHKINR